MYSGLPFDEALIKSEKKVEDNEIVTLLKQSAKPKKAEKKAKAKAKKEVSKDDKVDDANDAPMLVESYLT